ncbi:hypothetical protein [Halobacteriovorax marinus]|uniref:hypothetical protein n=1 Tax=Halobacteriovorax marinus TaxID=97084 RepID=UPI003A92C6B9
MKKLALFLLILCSNSFGFVPVYDCEEDFYSARILLEKIPEDVKIIDVYSVSSEFPRFGLTFDAKDSSLRFVPSDGWIKKRIIKEESWVTAVYRHRYGGTFFDNLQMKNLSAGPTNDITLSEYFKNYPDVIFKNGDRVVRFRFNKVNYNNIFLPYYIKVKNYFKYGTINPPILEKNRSTCTSPRTNIFLYDFVDE